jgi:hypothetical protein
VWLDESILLLTISYKHQLTKLYVFIFQKAETRYIISMKMGNKFYTEDAENKVLTEIINGGKEGIYQKEILARIPGIHRSTVNRVTARLEKRRLIGIISKGKTTKYIFRNNAQINAEIDSYILGNKFITDFSLFGREDLILCDKLRVTYPGYINFARYSSSLNQNLPKSQDLKRLFLNLPTKLEPL